MAFGNSGGEKKARGGALADINVTPLVDILLVLLIIFMVTAPTVFNATVQQPPDLQKPIEQPDPKNDQEEDIVKIDAKGTIKFRKNVLTQAQLYQLVKQDIEQGTQQLIQLNAASDGLQLTSDNFIDTRHFANTLFNIMRGGIFDHNYQIFYSFRESHE